MTLQEVEAISKEKINSAHGRQEIPQVDNPTWKTVSDENASDATSQQGGIDALPQQSEVSTPDLSDAAAYEEEPAIPYIGHQIPEDFLKKAGLLQEDGEREIEMRPLYNLNADGSLPGEQSAIFQAFRI